MSQFNFTTFQPGSVGATISAQQALRSSNLEMFIDSLGLHINQLQSMIELAPKICETILVRAQEQYEASRDQALGAIISGGLGVGAGIGAVGTQIYYSNKLDNANNNLNKQGEGALEVGVSKTQPTNHLEPQNVPSPKQKTEAELKQDIAQLNQQLQTIPSLWQHFGRALGELAQGTMKLFAAEHEKAAGAQESVQKWFESVQQTITRFMELLQAQKQLAERILDDTKRAHEEAIRAAAFKG